MTSIRLLKKIVLISGIFLCFILISLSGIGLYLYYHPERIKAVIENSLSAATGSACTMENISFSLRPMVLAASGILFKTSKPKQASSLEIPFIRTEMAIEGPWGRRSLILKNMRITGIFMDGALLADLPGKTGSSFPARMIQGIVSLFFFRDIQFESGEILDGHILASWGDQTIRACKIHAGAGIDEPLVLSFALEVENAARNLRVTAPNVHLISNNVFDIHDFKFNGTLQAENITLRDPVLGVQRMDVQSNFTYSQDRKHLKAENFQIHITGLDLMEKTDGRLPLMDVGLQVENLSYRYPVIEITKAALQIPRAKVHTETRDILMGDIGIYIPDARMDMERKSLAVPRIHCEALGLKNVLLAIDVKSDIKNGLKDGSINLVLEGEKTEFFQALIASKMIPSDWTLSVKDALRIKVAGPVAGPWQVSANLSLADLTFQNRNGSLMGEKISLSTEIQGVVDAKDAAMTFAVDLEAGAGEALYDRYYVNLAENPVVSSCKGTYQFKQKSLVKQKFLEISRLTFHLTDILPLEIQGFFKQNPPTRKAGHDADFTVIIPQVPVKPIFHHLLQEPYKASKPFLATLETEGTVSAEFTINQSENAWQVKGRLGWREGSLTFKDKGISLTGIHLDLPVWYRNGSDETTAESLKGRLAVGSVTLPPLPEQPLSILVDAGPNTISIDSPTLIQVPGGEIRLGTVAARNIYGPDISVHTRLAIDGINMQALLSGIGALPPEATPEGSLMGILDPIRYEKYAVTSQGTMKAKVFGGEILLTDLGASGIFTSAPVFKLNADWDGLLLSEMTTDTAFGKIEGVLKGHLRDVEIAWGQPQKFDLLLESVETRGIPQTISITAVDNIAQIGGGQSPFMGLAGAFASVFEKFPYEKIGIRAVLDNDMFTINGTIREGGEEYIVKRRGFSGVNIINQNPDNRIHFKDMVKRIQRIAHKDGAVIN